MDYILFRKLLYWAKRKLQNPKNFVEYRKFWYKVNGKLKFSYKKRDTKKFITISSYREVAKSYSIVKYVKVKGDASVYNGDVNYWSKRAITPELKTKTRDILLKRQDYKCIICGFKFLPGDVIEPDHIKPKAEGGKHKIANLQLVHASLCHGYKR